MKKHIIALCLVLLMITSFCCGCVTVVIENPDDNKDKLEKAEPTVTTTSESKENLYTSTANIIILSQDSSQDISNDRLNSAQGFVDTYEVLLKSPAIQAEVKAAYPNAEYTCALKSINNTSIFSIVVKSKEKESLKEICELITNEFCARLPSVFEDITVKITAPATEPKEVTD